MSNLILSDRESFELELDYWKSKLKGVAPLHLFADYTSQSLKSTNKATTHFSIDKKTQKQLSLLSEGSNVTISTVLVAAFQVLLYRCSGLEDICVGNIIPEVRIEKDGEFSNVVALRTELGADDRFLELLQRINSALIEGYQHQNLPFQQVADTVIKDNDLTWNPLLQVMFVFQNQSEFLNLDTTKSDLAFILKSTDSGIQGTIDYNADLYDEDKITRIIAYYQNLLHAIDADPNKSIGAYPMLTKTEEHSLLEELNDTTVGYPEDKTVVDLFEEQVEKTPDNVAVVFEDKGLTYRELNVLSNQLADYLRKTYHIKPDDLIALKLERSEWMIVAMLAVMKAGGAYVPIDPGFPEERTDYIVKDSGSKALVDEAELTKFRNLKDKYSADNQATGLQPRNLIYCIYTSGSTGNPKGVLLEHYNVVRLLYTDKPLFDFNERDVWTMFHSYNFDFSVWEMYGAILFGGKVVVVSKAVAQDSDVFLNLLKKEEVTILNQTPSSFYNLIDADGRSNTAGLNLRYVIFGGEALQPARLAGFKSKYDSTMLINMYGITETTVHVTYKVIGIEEITNGASNIGVPIPTLSCYIMNEHLQLVPIGTVGELFVGGSGLARGYLNRPELTAEKFIDNPYRPGERIYRSGDLAKLLADGNLEYLGRIDDQVKIRGFRIELGEIASALLKHDKVTAAVVIAKAISGPEKELIAYTTGTAGANELRDYLKEKLPAYMVPGYYVQLDSIPLTANGKVNKKILPVPVNSGIDLADYVAPSSDIEKILVKIWSEVLAIPADKISVKGNFFDMGGHSIKAIRLLGLIHKQLGVKLVLKELFSGNTIQQQAIAITQKEQARYSSVQTVAEKPDYSVSSAQRRLWVLNHFEGAQNAYNIPSVIMLDGVLCKEALKKTFQSLIARHEILRTVFKEDKDGNPRQKVLSSAEYAFTLRETDLRNTADQEKQLNRLVNLDTSGSFDLSEGPLLRCHLIQLEENKHVLVMVQHHIISDGWSMDIFREDLSSLYNAYVLGKTPKLPKLGIQYKDYAAWHTQQLETANLRPHKEYWLKQFEGEIPILEIPADKDRPNVKSYNGSGFTANIDNNVLSGLNKIAKANGGTLFMSLLACVNTLFYRYTSQEDIVIGSPIAGREHPDLEDQIGFYINTLALRTRFDGTGSYDDLFQHIKEVTLSAYEHQLYPYDELVDTLKLPRNMNRNPLFDVMVVLQNSMEQDAKFKLDGLETENYETGDYRVSKFDINFVFSETKDGLNLFLEYNTDIYSGEQIKYMLAHLENIISSIAQNPKQRLSDIDFLTNSEKQSLLYDFNDTIVDYPKANTITDLFENQVLKTPQATALLQHELTMTYSEVNERANQLAHYLIEQGVKVQDNIGLLVERGFDMIIGMYAIMKAGAAYVPIDPDYPLERQEYILKNSAAVKVISDGNYPLEQFLSEDQFIKLNKLDLSGYKNENPGLKIDSKQLAYTIYTSGSTGRPKGVMIEHHSAVNLLTWVNKEFNIGANDRVLFITSMCFDLSVYDIFGLLAAGGSVVIVEQQELMDVPKLKDMLLRYKITYWDSVPSTMDYLVRELESTDSGYLQHSLRVVFMSGDWIPVDLPTRIRNYFPETRVIGLGGATEATVWSNFFPVEKVESNWKSIPYGRPMDNNFFYILDKLQKPVPRGVVGELYIGGVGVARGYANDKEKTDYAFVTDPFNNKAGGRMYRTGDLGRMLPGMNMEFIGRKDDQVKIRGYRIELGEIETVIRQCELVSQAIVLARTDKEGKKRLVSYVVGKKGLYTRDAVVAYIKSKLPDYMVPNLWMELDALPLTSNGKIDKKSLPDIDFEEQLKEKYVAPSTQSERLLAGIWQEVLKLKEIGTEDNFFDIGGHSLLAVQIITRIENKTGKKFPITILFEYPTIKSLDAFIQKDSDEKIWKSLVPIKPTGSKMPLYIVHGVGLNVLSFSSLALHVDKEQPLYGLQARGLDGIEEPLNNIPEIASHYVDEVIEHNPFGPYAIAGYSIGGIIAVEMVRQLKEMNKEVKMLAVLDTDADETNKEKWYVILPKKLKRYSPKFMGGTKSFSKQLLSIIEKQLISTLKKVGLSKETAETKAYYAMLDNISDKLIEGYMEYDLTPFDGSVYIFNAEICEHYTDDTEFLGWQKFALQGVNRYVVPGSHLSMLQSPNVDKFGAILQEVLDNLQ